MNYLNYLQQCINSDGIAFIFLWALTAIINAVLLRFAYRRFFQKRYGKQPEKCQEEHIIVLGCIFHLLAWLMFAVIWGNQRGGDNYTDWSI